MATTRTTAQRRRSKAMRSQTAYVRVTDDESDGGGGPPPTPPRSPGPDGRDADQIDAPGSGRIPAWPAVIGLVLSVLGLAVAAYLTYAHYTTAKNLACSDSGLFNCAAVTTSRYSHLFGFPVSVLGLLFFAFMIPLQLPVAWRSPRRAVRSARLGASVVGVGMIVYLIYCELIKLRSLCLYCSIVHVLTFLLFVTVALGTIATAPEPL
jgi:uncharacterized membrane protein